MLFIYQNKLNGEIEIIIHTNFSNEVSELTKSKKQTSR